MSGRVWDDGSTSTLHSMFCTANAVPKFKMYEGPAKGIQENRTATPIARSLTYLLKCVMHETKPFPRSFSQHLVQAKVFQAWQERSNRLESNIQRQIELQVGGEAQELCYNDNPSTRGINFNKKIWTSKVIDKLIEISLELWDTRDKALHGIKPEEQHRIQRVGAIHTVTSKFQEGNRSIQVSFPRLYMDSCQTLCDKPTLQLLKWIETFNICRGYMAKEEVLKRRGRVQDIKQAYKGRTELSHYVAIRIFQ